MPNKMLIDATHPEETRVVVVRGNRVEEFDFETAQRKQLRGNIYLAKVTRVEPSLQAAFIEYGGNRHGFLAFSEIHPDYYQIPVADRQALIEADEQAHREAEEESENRSRGGGRRSRHRNSRRRNQGERVQSAVVEGADATEIVGVDPALSSEGLAEAHAGHADDSAHDHGAPDHGAYDHDAPRHDDGEQLQVHAGDHDHGNHRDDTAPADAVADAPAPYDAAQDTPAHTLHAGGDGGDVTSADAPAYDDHEHEDHAHDGQSADTHLAAPDTTSESDEDDDEDEDEEDDEEDEVESVGGDDVLEEVPERAFRPRRQYKIQEVIKRRQVMLVQVVKEERGNKGAALTTYLSLAGRYAVLMPNTARGGGISRKITSAQDRSRLKEVVQDLDVPEGMGIILRTAGASRTKPEIKRDFEYLIRMWETVRDLTLRSQAPTLVYEEGSLIKRSLRDLYNKEIDEILVAGDGGYREARDFMKMLMPQSVRAVKQYRETQPLYSRMGVESQLDAMFSPTVQLRSGGYIVLNQTEALVAIDVNSGRSTREHHIEDTALKTNLEAAEEVARQLRLRDLAGLIVIDFIDMDEKRNNRAVERKLSDCLRQDRARIQVGRISHFGLLEMSRQRIRASVLESSTEPCPHCGGSGHVRSVSSVALQLLRSVEEQLMKGATHSLTVRTRTDVALYVLNHKRGHLRDLEDGFHISIAVVADATVHGQQAFFIDRGELVHTAEAAKAILTQQLAALPAQDEPADDGDDFDVEAEVETEETEGLVADGAEADDIASAEGDNGGEADGRRRRRRRRRRGRDEGRDAGEGRETAAAGVGDELSADIAGAASDPADDGEADDEASEGDGHEVGNARGAETGERGENGERRPRRRGRRGGRRRRNGDDGPAGSTADEFGPTPVPETSFAAVTLDDTVGSDRVSDDAVDPVSPHETSDQPWIEDGPVSSAPQTAIAAAQPDAAPETVAEALHERTVPAVEAPASASSDAGLADDGKTRRRSTVREKVSFGTSAAATASAVATAVSDVATTDVPATVSASDAEAAVAAQPSGAAGGGAEDAATADASPKKGWWSRRFGG